jgi:branched-chain amino acid transport system permease protein
MIEYLVYLAAVAGVYALLGLSLNLLWGMSGMVNMGLVGVFACGAYASALLTVKAGWPIALGWFGGMVAASIAGFVLSGLTRKMSGDYLAIVTLGFAEVVRLVATNETWLTRGSDGISGIPAPLKAQLGPGGFNWFYAGLTWVIVAMVAWLLARLYASPYGRALRALRDDPVVAAVAGKPVARIRLEVFCVSCAIAGLAGALYGHFTSFISPDLFVPLLTIYVFLTVAVGGTGRPRGPLLGAVVVLAILEGTRFIAALAPGLSAVQVAALREFIVGAGLVALLHVRAQGLLPERIVGAPRAASN